MLQGSWQTIRAEILELAQKVGDHKLAQKVEDPELAQKMEDPEKAQKVEDPELTQKVEHPESAQKREDPESAQKGEDPDLWTKDTQNLVEQKNRKIADLVFTEFRYKRTINKWLSIRKNKLSNCFKNTVESIVNFSFSEA